MLGLTKSSLDSGPWQGTASGPLTEPYDIRHPGPGYTSGREPVALRCRPGEVSLRPSVVFSASRIGASMWGRQHCREGRVWQTAGNFIEIIQSPAHPCNCRDPITMERMSMVGSLMPMALADRDGDCDSARRLTKHYAGESNWHDSGPPPTPSCTSVGVGRHSPLNCGDSRGSHGVLVPMRPKRGGNLRQTFASAACSCCELILCVTVGEHASSDALHHCTTYPSDLSLSPTAARIWTLILCSSTGE
jgi:hypothetical protein